MDELIEKVVGRSRVQTGSSSSSGGDGRLTEARERLKPDFGASDRESMRALTEGA